jgi:hypothetical protein
LPLYHRRCLKRSTCPSIKLTAPPQNSFLKNSPKSCQAPATPGTPKPRKNKGDFTEKILA